MTLLDPAELRRLYWDEGLTITQVARRLHTAEQRVLATMDAHDIPRRPRGKRPATVPLTEIVRSYTVDGRTIKETAHACGLTYSAVQQALAQHAIPPTLASRSVADHL